MAGGGGEVVACEMKPGLLPQVPGPREGSGNDYRGSRKEKELEMGHPTTYPQTWGGMDATSKAMGCEDNDGYSSQC